MSRGALLALCLVAGCGESPTGPRDCSLPPLTTWVATGVPGQAIVPSAKRPEKRGWPQDLTSNVVPEGYVDVVRDASVHLLAWSAGPSRICVLVHDLQYVDEDNAGICAISNSRENKVGPENTCRPIGGGICSDFSGYTPAVAWFAEGTDGWRLLPGERLIARVTGPMAESDQIVLRYSGWRRPAECVAAR
jgi:hypothetical protein